MTRHEAGDVSFAPLERSHPPQKIFQCERVPRAGEKTWLWLGQLSGKVYVV